MVMKKTYAKISVEIEALPVERYRRVRVHLFMRLLKFLIQRVLPQGVWG